MQTYRVNLKVKATHSEDVTTIPAFSVTAPSPALAIAKVMDIIDGLGGFVGFERLESGYIVDREGTRHGIV